MHACTNVTVTYGCSDLRGDGYEGENRHRHLAAATEGRKHHL